MPDTAATTPETGYLLVSYRADGSERSEAGALRSDHVARRISTEPVTDVVLLSHGWQGDVSAARRQYDACVATMRRHAWGRQTMAEKVPELRILVVGRHWPSKAWGDEELGGGAFAATAGAAVGPAPSIEAVITQYASRLDTSSSAARPALRTIMTAALEDIAPETMPPGAMLETCGSAGRAYLPGDRVGFSSRPTLTRRSGRYALAHRSARGRSG